MSENMNFATVIPTMRYNDASSAIEWLCKVFGFKKHLVVPGDEGKITHAQLTFGNGMIMLGSAAEDEYGALVQPPASESSPCTQSPYIIVDELAGKSRFNSKKKIMGVRFFRAAIPKGSSGTLVATIPGLLDNRQSVLPPNKSLQRPFDSLPIFAAAKTGIASNAAELRR
jgi:uncharacterized glyoxalase superfamily protein PhnB